LHRSISTEEFSIRNINVTKKSVYTRGAAVTFEEISYEITLHRFPHFYVINFILPMVAVTMLTVGSMWMTSAGMRMNSGTKLLLCVVSIMNVTSGWRPAGHGDIWLDRFQSHSLGLSMSAVLQSLVVDYIQRHARGLASLPTFGWRIHAVDIMLRTFITFLTILVFLTDFCTVRRTNWWSVFRSFHAPSQQLLLGFVYVVFIILGVSSACSALWLVLPREQWKSWVEKVDRVAPPGTSKFLRSASHAVPLPPQDEEYGWRSRQSSKVVAVCQE
jgi:hypothetical protein